MDKRNPTDLGFSFERLGQVDESVTRAIEEGEIAGGVTAIVRHGSLAFISALGRRSIEDDLPMDEDSLFRIYSMTKPITSAAAMLLVERCRINLHAPISTILPAFAEMEVYLGGEAPPFRTEPAEREITLHDLLTHTAGLSYGTGDEHPVEQAMNGQVIATLGPRPETSLRELAALVAEVPLVHQPGTAWRYSIAIDVIGALIEEITGMDFGEFLRTELFEPLGMKDTFFTVPEDKRDRLACVYTDGEQGLTIAEDPQHMAFTSPRRNPSGGGGLVSTAVDYLRFCQMLLDEGYAAESGRHILSPATVRMMLTDHLPPGVVRTDSPGTGFGYGGAIVTDTRYFRGYGWQGDFFWGGAASTQFVVSPAQDLAMVFMTQRMPGSTSDVNGHVGVSVCQSLIS